MYVRQSIGSSVLCMFACVYDIKAALAETMSFV